MFSHILKTFLVFFVCTNAYTTNVYAVQKEDPLRPPEYKIKKTSASITKKTTHGWRVNEILFSGERRVALVNGIAVIKGDRVNGARVIDIKPKHVVLEYKKKRITARLKMITVKKKTNRK